MKTFQKLKADPQLWERYWVREKVIDAIRAFFKREGFHEVMTPLLLPTPSTEPNLEVFETSLVDDHGKRVRAFLPSSPEFALKKLLSAGSGSIFEITKSFRNGEGKSSRHNPEFTILEWYRTPGNYMDIVSDFEKLMREITRTVPVKSEHDLSSPWERISVAEAFAKYAGVDEETMLNGALLIAHGKRKGYTVSAETTWEEIWNQIIANEIEPKLGQKGPTVLYDYPVQQAAFAKKKASDPRYAERLEVYLAGFELGNAFSELTDAEEQKERCLADLAERKALGKTEYPMDQDFITALEMGMPETGGIAVGVDRLVAFFAGTDDIAKTLFFPSSELFKWE